MSSFVEIKVRMTRYSSGAQLDYRGKCHSIYQRRSLRQWGGIAAPQNSWKEAKTPPGFWGRTVRCRTYRTIEKCNQKSSPTPLDFSAGDLWPKSPLTQTLPLSRWRKRQAPHRTAAGSRRPSGRQSVLVPLPPDRAYPGSRAGNNWYLFRGTHSTP